MKSHRIATERIATVLVALLGVLALGVVAQEESPAGSFGESIDVTAVELMIDIRDRKGDVPAGLTADDFEVLEDGRPVRIIGLDYPEGWRLDPVEVNSEVKTISVTKTQSYAVPEPEVEAPAAKRPWRTLIYIEGALVSTGSLQRNVKTLRQRIPELVREGPVEIVLANPMPAVLMPFTTDPTRLEKALDTLAKRVQPTNEVAQIRQNFIRERDRRFSLKNTVASDVTTQHIRDTAQRENFVLLRQMGIFTNWMRVYGYDPGAVVLVTDGFDLDPADFYLEAATNTDAGLTGELMRYQLDDEVEYMSESLAARGWTSYIMATGSLRAPDAADASLAGRERFRSIGDGDTNPAAGTVNGLVTHPLEPLLITADETGGEVLTNPKKALAALDRLGQKLRLTYLAERAADGQQHNVEVRLKERNKKLKLRWPRLITSATGEQVAEARARRLLVTDTDQGELPVEVALQATGAKTDKSQPTEIAITFDLNQLREVLDAAPRPIRFTIGVEIAGSPPFVHQVIQEVNIPGRESTFPKFLYKTVLGMPPQAGRVSVVVEEPGTGMWGGVVSGS